MKFPLRTNLYLLSFCSALSLLACKQNTPAPPETKAESPQRKIQKIEFKDQIVSELAQEAFFERYKTLKTINKSQLPEENIVVQGYYEFYEAEGKKILHGTSCFGLMGMGFGSGRCAQYQDGVLHGQAYEYRADPGEYRLTGLFDQGQLKTAQYRLNDGGQCRQSPLIEAKNKNFEAFAKDFDKADTPDFPHRLEEIPCEDNSEG